MERNNFGLRIDGETDPAKELNPYEKLYMAILIDAIETLTKHHHVINNNNHNRYVAHRHYKVREGRRTPIDPVGEAWDWLMSDDEESCLAFAAICQHFNWDHRWIRKKTLEAIKKANSNRTAPQPQHLKTG